MSYTPYKPEPAQPLRPGADAALKVPSLSNGERINYKPPAPICVGVSKGWLGAAK